MAPETGKRTRGRKSGKKSTPGTAPSRKNLRSQGPVAATEAAAGAASADAAVTAAASHDPVSVAPAGNNAGRGAARVWGGEVREASPSRQSVMIKADLRPWATTCTAGALSWVLAW